MHKDRCVRTEYTNSLSDEEWMKADAIFRRIWPLITGKYCISIPILISTLLSLSSGNYTQDVVYRSRSQQLQENIVVQMWYIAFPKGNDIITH